MPTNKIQSIHYNHVDGNPYHYTIGTNCDEIKEVDCSDETQYLVEIQVFKEKKLVALFNHRKLEGIFYGNS